MQREEGRELGTEVNGGGGQATQLAQLTAFCSDEGWRREVEDGRGRMENGLPPSRSARRWRCGSCGGCRGGRWWSTRTRTAAASRVQVNTHLCGISEVVPLSFFVPGYYYQLYQYYFYQFFETHYFKILIHSILLQSTGLE